MTRSKILGQSLALLCATLAVGLISHASLAQSGKAQAGTKAKATPKYTVCTVTINSADEGELFKSKLKPASDFEFLEIVPERAQSDEGGAGNKAGGANWFQEACAKLKAEQKSCDLLVISGHFGGTFFGSSGRRLPLEVLEEMGCNDSCPGIMHSPKEVFMFGCNTLSGKGADDRGPEERYL